VLKDWFSNRQADRDELVEDFIALFLNFKMVPPLVLFQGSVPRGSPQSPYQLTSEEAIAKAHSTKQVGRWSLKTFICIADVCSLNI
jgi:hypothetical protein